MAQKTDVELTAEANVIGNETVAGANTKTRVATMLKNIIDSKGNNSNFVDKETPTGLINSANVTYTLAFTPIADSEYVYLNGLLMETGDDYTILVGTITMVTAPETGDRLKVSYRK